MIARPGVRQKLVTVVLLATMLVIHNAHRTGVVTVFDDLRLRFDTDYAGVGTIFSAYVFGYGLAQLAMGVAGSRLNARHMLLAGLALSVIFSAVFAGTTSQGVALVARFLLGATGALLYTPSIKLGIVLFERSERGKVLGVLQAGAGVGSSGAMIAVPALEGVFGLTGAFLSLTALTASALVAAIFLVPGDAPVSEERAEAAPLNLTRRADFWQLVAISFVGMLAIYGLLTWLPTYLTDDFGYSQVRAGTVASLANLALLLAAPLVGEAADLPHGRNGVVVGGSALAALSFGLMVAGQSIPIVLVATVLTGLSLAATTAPLMLLAGERFGAAHTARVVGFVAAAAQLGGTLAGSIFGLVLTHGGGFRAVWTACAAFALLRLALLLDLLRRDRRRAVTAEASA